MLNPDDSRTIPDKEEPPLSRVNRAQWIVAGFLFTAFVIGALLYRTIMRAGLGHTSLMFIGVPAVLAIILVLAPIPKSATGSILRGITLALLIVAPLLGEGYLCILFASPLFLLVGLVIGKLVDFSRARRSTTLSCIAIVLLPLSLEGIFPQLTHDRAQFVEATKIIHAPASQVEAALAESPEITTSLPRFLRIGFPRPLEAHGSGLALNNLRTIHFAGAEGDPPGDLVMRVSASQTGYVRFETISDSSKLLQWVRWRSSEVTYTPVDPTHTKVTWRISFDRQLDPYWYFAPWEQFAVRQAANYLITANATPRR
ncbi:MAG TPA: SRPBCC family protein [Acidobacteriaceae bacterium]